RLAGLDVAEAAAAGADVPEDHEGRGPPFPALADVRAVRLLAHGVEVLGVDRLLQPAIGGPPWRRDLEPGRLSLAKRPPIRDSRPPRVGAGAGHMEPLRGLHGPTVAPARRR